MPTFRFRGLGNKGVVTDLPPFDLSPDTWSAANNVRFQAGRVQKVGGTKPALTRNMPAEIPLSIVQRPLSESLIYGTYNPATKRGHLWQAEGVQHTNISKLNGSALTDYEVYPAQTWDYTTLSNVVIFNAPLLIEPQGLVPGTENFINLPNWGYPNGETNSSGVLVPVGTKATWSANKVRAYKNYLICLGMTENGVEYRQRVRWSDVTYLNNLPTNWFQNLETSDGGFNDLSDSQSHILDGRPLRDSFIIYTNRDTYIMDYVGGNMIFNFRKIFSDSGILAPNCCIEFEGKHFVISEEDIFVHNGSTKQSVATSRIKEKLMTEISSVNYLATKIYSYPTRKEIWIAYVGPGNTELDASGDDNFACDRVAIWSWEFDTWSFADLPNIYDIGLGIPPDTDARIWDKYDPDSAEGADGPEWDSSSVEEDVWEEFAQTFTAHVMFAPSRDGFFYNLDTGYYTYSHNSTTKLFDRTPVVCEVTRQGIDMDEQEPDINSLKWWRNIYPQMSGIGTVRFFVGGSDNPYKDPVWDSSMDYTIGTDTKVDCFSNYRYPAIRVQDSAEGAWGFTGFDVDYFKEGNR